MRNHVFEYHPDKEPSQVQTLGVRARGLCVQLGPTYAIIIPRTLLLSRRTEARMPTSTGVGGSAPTVSIMSNKGR